MTKHHTNSSFKFRSFQVLGPLLKNAMLLLFLLVFYTLNAQETLSQLLKKNNTHSIPYISVQELAMPKTEAILLDAREKKEFDISHIRNAIHVGYDFFNLDTVQQMSGISMAVFLNGKTGIFQFIIEIR